MLPDFRKNISAVGKSPALQQISGTGGNNLTGYIPNARGIPCTSVTCSLQISYVLAWNRTQAAAVRGRLLTTRAMARVIKPCSSSKFSCYHAHKKRRPIQWISGLFPRGRAGGTWIRSLTFIKCQGWEWAGPSPHPRTPSRYRQGHFNMLSVPDKNTQLHYKDQSVIYLEFAIPCTIIHSNASTNQMQQFLRFITCRLNIAQQLQ